MKEQYIPPELNVVCFAPVERLTLTNDFDLDNLMNLGGQQPGVSGVDEGDFGLDIL